MTGPRVSRGRILMVEDDEGLRRVLTMVLTADGYEVTDVGTVQAAIKESPPWDLLLLDRRLPNGDGKLVAEHFKDVPTLYMSGYEPEGLPKPFTPGQLRDKIEETMHPPQRPEAP